jgi:hypothetical protein
MINKETTITYSPYLSVQQIRLLDVFLVAPFCFYVANQTKISKPIKIGLLVLGVSTLIYNGHNYIKNKELSIRSKVG